MRLIPLACAFAILPVILAMPAAAQGLPQRDSVRPVERAVSGQAEQAVRPNVREVQTMLARLGYYSGSADGSTGAKTRTAITAFQRAQGLPADGAITPGLVSALKRASRG